MQSVSKWTLFLLLIFTARVNAQVNVVAAPDTAELADLISSSTLHISNVEVKCDSLAYGEFSGQSELPITHGIFISTGKTSDLFCSNNAGNTSTIFGTTDTIANFEPALDVCAIEFDVRSTVNTMDFIFSFGSEEYPEFVFSPYNDVFKILISGPRPSGGQYINLNMAWLPDNTTTSIAHINPFSNQTYFYDNTFPPGSFISYDGLTTYFLASIQVIPDSTYHIIFAVGDKNDAYYDSAGFIATEDSENHHLPVMPAAGVDCYPNPVTDELIWLPAAGTAVQSADLYNTLGELVYSVADPNAQRSIDMRNFSVGCYFLHIEIAFRVYTYKIVKI